MLLAVLVPQVFLLPVFQPAERVFLDTRAPSHGYDQLRDYYLHTSSIGMPYVLDQVAKKGVRRIGNE